MTADDPLTGLDDIPWGSLSHAYGSAEDVPHILRALLSKDGDVREEARFALYSNIYHQGTRYEATHYAVPFLARLTLADSTPERDHIVLLLAAIAIGYDSRYLPQGYDPETDRRTLAELRAETPETWERKLDAWVAEATDKWERRHREGMRFRKSLDSQLRNAEAEVLAYEAIRNELPVLTPLLETGDPALRTAIAYLLAWFPEAAEQSLPALLTMLGSETAAWTVATAVVAVGLLSGPEAIPTIRHYLAGSEPALRWAAAVALARLGEADNEVVTELATTTAEAPEGDDPYMPFLKGDCRGLAAKSLAATATATDLPPGAFEALLTGLNRSTEESSSAIASAVLQLAFPTGAADPRPPFDQLSADQQSVVRALASMDRETWQWVDPDDIVGPWGLPTQLDELRTYAGLPEDPA